MHVSEQWNEESVIQTKSTRPSFLKSLFRSRNAVIGLFIVGLFLFCALCAPLIAGHDPYEINLAARELAPSLQHPMGTDSLGRDVFARVVYGTRISLKVGVIAISISLLIGVLLGALSGFWGGTLDMMVMRATDIFMALPAAILALAVMAIFENPSINKIFFVLGFIGWTTIARLVRSRVMEIRNEEYVLASAALGFSRMRTLFRHILPNSMAPIIVAATIGIAGNVLTEAWLSFLGLGAQPHIPSWGRMITEGQSYLVTATKPWIYIFPGLALFLTVMGFNLLGDGLRDVLDPTIRE
jgi:ABC-type dipeptide/oligopeptide/nickel transport system permease subunit